MNVSNIGCYLVDTHGPTKGATRCHRISKNFILVLTLGLAAIGLAGCGSSSVVSGGSYLSSSRNYAILLQFTAANGKINGTVQYAYLSANSTKTSTSNGAITGTVSASSLTIDDVDNVLNIGGIASGTISGTGFELAIPQQDGQIGNVAFSPSSVASYNSAVAALQRQARRTAQAQAAAAAKAAATAHTEAVAAANSMVRKVCRSACPSLLPTVAAGYQPLAAFGPNRVSATVNFNRAPLEICFAVASNSVKSLSYEIGTPFSGPTTIFDASNGPLSFMQGCVADSGNDNGPTSVVVTPGGTGSWVVRIDEQSQ